ncbi:hypothetical protein MLD38_007014 [Melastoma candidum]|uniref:Uncharacterized protein n=1 Tax=Melastoma candidum TaxID=119954 RepID=A0ACB9RPQ0_9MYRT|nr:hypothetical protein MLD38_007014 [Melastoma candidum]
MPPSPPFDLARQSVSMNNPNVTSPNPHEFLRPMLKESVDRFLLEHGRQSSDLSHFSSVFARLLRGLPSPPLEIAWFYCAATPHSSMVAGSDPLGSDQVSRVKELFQLLVSCSDGCSPVKKVAFLAPVVCELYRLVSEWKVLKTEALWLLDVMISYMIICCGSGFCEDEESENLSLCFLDVVRVWTADKCRSGMASDSKRSFFPLVSEGVCEEIGEGCKVGFLAGIVMSQVFLLRLCLKFDQRTLRAELGKDMLTWSVNTIAGFRNFYFMDILLRMLLPSVLPCTPLLKFEDENYLREVLYDCLIMVDYPFLNPQTERELCGKGFKNTVILLLLVAESAIRFVRENGDDEKVHLYSKALSESRLSFHLIEWVTYQIDYGSISKPTHLSPASLMKWLLTAENLGMKVFDNDDVRLHAKAVICRSRGEIETPVDKPRIDEASSFTHNEVPWNYLLEENWGKVDSMDTCQPEITTVSVARKRKEGRRDGLELPFKLLRCTRENYKFLVEGMNGGLSNGIRVNDLHADESALAMEH